MALVSEYLPEVEAVQPTVSGGPRMPKRTAWIDLPGEYGEAGMRMLCWTNYPYSIWKALELGIGGPDSLNNALHACVLEHNGWTDADGNPLPDAQADRFWWRDDVSPELVGVVISTLLDVPRRYPKGLRKNGTN